MYEQYWGLDHKPFENRHQPRFYFPSSQHQAAELKLRYVLESRLPAALITGGPGVGKSMLLQLIEMQQQSEAAFHRVHFSRLPASQLLACIAAKLHGEPIDAQLAAGESLRRIEEGLAELASQQRHACLVIDECHVMPEESLETVRQLLNLAQPSGWGLTVLLAGQSSFLRTLQTMPQFEERLAVKLNLSRLSEGDTAAYVRHRLAAAGARRPIFSDASLVELHQRTLGVPGRINRIGDMLLLVGYADDIKLVTPEHVQQVDQGLFTMPWAA